MRHIPVVLKLAKINTIKYHNVYVQPLILFYNSEIVRQLLDVMASVEEMLARDKRTRLIEVSSCSSY